jgi:hypothetical protein
VNKKMDLDLIKEQGTNPKRTRDCYENVRKTYPIQKCSGDFFDQSGELDDQSKRSQGTLHHSRSWQFLRCSLVVNVFGKLARLRRTEQQIEYLRLKKQRQHYHAVRSHLEALSGPYSFVQGATTWFSLELVPVVQALELVQAAQAQHASAWKKHQHHQQVSLELVPVSPVVLHPHLKEQLASQSFLIFSTLQKVLSSLSTCHHWERDSSVQTVNHQVELVQEPQLADQGREARRWWDVMMTPTFVRRRDLWWLRVCSSGHNP